MRVRNENHHQVRQNRRKKVADVLRDMDVCNEEEEKEFSGSELLKNIQSIDNDLCDKDSSTLPLPTSVRFPVSLTPIESLQLPTSVPFPVSLTRLESKIPQSASSIQFEVNNQHRSFLAELDDCANIYAESPTAYARTFTSL